jgi:hypothetical protein
MTSGELLADFSPNAKAVQAAILSTGIPLPHERGILIRIGSEFKMVYQYLDDLKDGLRMHPGEGVSSYISKPEALIEVLEIHDCGSLGGFDPDCGGCSTLKNALRLSSASTILR